MRKLVELAIFANRIWPGRWDSTNAKWRISDGILPRKRLKRAARPNARSSRMPSISSMMERAPGQTDSDAILANDRSWHHGGLLVSLGALPGLPHYDVNRPAHARSPPRRRGDQPDPRAVVPIRPAECAVYRSVPPPSSIGPDEGNSL
jgi:hypothetical protein